MSRLSKIGAACLAAFGWTSGVSTVTASYLVVAGGGGGGSLRGGGGGAGGFLSGTASLDPTLTYTVTVGGGGAGGAGGSGAANIGTSGSGSVFGIYSAAGGGGGGQNTVTGLSGGSGGGGGFLANGGTGNTPSTSPAQGTNGGAGATTAPPTRGGGGGGATSAGATGDASGNGGNGTASSISGSSVTYAGGGGGGGQFSAGGAGTGGTGGGGAGNATSDGTSGTVNLGGGGGGSGYSSGAVSGTGGSGGSGIVIISYPAPQRFGGGIVTTSGGNIIHTFKTSGTLVPATPITASYLIVAGGGGAGGDLSGGGGAGGLLTGTGLTIDPNSSYLVTVGAGGAGNTGSGVGTNGSDSALSMYATAAVGGGGGAGDGTAASVGGSGGGGSSQKDPANGTSGQGNAGGNRGGSAGSGTGGGGGAGAAGSNGSSAAGNGGNGGIGVSSSISGTATYYAGGGGGGGDSRVGGSTAGTGGSGGGGNGGRGAAGTAATANTGGGGGGGGQSGGDGAAGGSGVVIISYPGSTQLLAGGTVTIVGGNVIHTFTTSGYLAPIKYANNSLRFRRSASANLTRTPTVASNRKTWTWSGWAKLGIMSTAGVDQALFTAGYNTVPWFALQYQGGSSPGTLQVAFTAGSSAGSFTNALYRDPSAWYHIVLAVDTTQATAANRVLLYVNGVLQTFASTAYPAQNYDTQVNSLVSHTIGGYSGSYYDGYMAEVNFVDGQALAPTAFGSFNSYGVWQPITYGGSYGTNGFYLSYPSNASSYVGSFNGSSQGLSGTLASALGSGNLTVEGWFYQNTLTDYQTWFSITRGAGGFNIGTDAAGSLVWYSGGARQIAVSGVVKTGRWQHVAFVRSGTTVTAYLNGVAQGTASVSTNFTATGFFINSLNSASEWVNAYTSNLRVTNTAVYTSNFTPSTSPLTAVSGTILLTLQNASIVDNSGNSTAITNVGTVTTAQTYPFTTGIFNDQGPAGNNWTPNNISGAPGSTLDYMTDVPTLTSATAANYCVANPLLSNSSITFSNANLTLAVGATGGVYRTAGGTFAQSTGKWYWEFTFDNIANNPLGGVGDITLPKSTWESDTTVNSGFWFINAVNGNKVNGGSSTSYGSAFTTSNICMVALDMDNNKIWWGKDGVWFASGDPAAGTNAAYTNLASKSLTCAFMGGAGSGGGNNYTLNFGQRPFVYTPPSGYIALNTYNM